MTKLRSLAPLLFFGGYILAALIGSIALYVVPWKLNLSGVQQTLVAAACSLGPFIVVGVLMRMSGLERVASEVRQEWGKDRVSRQVRWDLRQYQETGDPKMLRWAEKRIGRLRAEFGDSSLHAELERAIHAAKRERPAGSASP